MPRWSAHGYVHDVRHILACNLASVIRLGQGWAINLACWHKRMAWGCSHNPNPEKLAIMWAKIFKIWAKYTATFTCKSGSVYVPN